MMTSNAVGDNLLNDKNTIAPDNKDKTKNKDKMKKFRLAKRAKKKGSKKHNNYLSALEPKNGRALIHTIPEATEFDRTVYSTKRRRVPLSKNQEEILKKNGIPLGKVLAKGQKTPIWRFKDETNNQFFVVGNAKSQAVLPTLAAAIKAYKDITNNTISMDGKGRLDRSKSLDHFRGKKL